VINELLNGVKDAIVAEFGDKYEVYTGRVAQGLAEPCFFIKCLNPTNNLALGLHEETTRRETTTLFSIQYFPQSDSEEVVDIEDLEGEIVDESDVDYVDEIYTDFNDVYERLVRCLEYITAGHDLVRGYDFTSAESDGVMTFTVTYSVPLIIKTDNTKMHTLEQKEGVYSG
jgi:hypothetical protein